MDREKIKTILSSKDCREKFNNYGINRLYLFGSYARGEQNINSDIDLLFEYDNAKYKITLFDLMELEDYVKSILHVEKVDIGSKRSVSEYIKEEVIKDLFKIF